MVHSFCHRTELLIGREALAQLRSKHVLLFGLGGVGAYAGEALCRAGIGRFTLIDPDVITPSNANRQILALRSTMGQKKVEVMAARMKDINPDVELTLFPAAMTPQGLTHGQIEWESVSYCVDAIDDVKAKVALIGQCLERRIPVISAMGAGNSLDHTTFQVADISKTHHCPLAKAVRLGLRKAGYERGVKVVYKPIEVEGRKGPCGTISYVPGILGLMLAGETIQDMISSEG